MEKNIHQEVDCFTQEGHKALGQGKIDEAHDYFEKAATLSSQIKEGFTERACYFNLGACCVAQGDSIRGLEYLKKAFPPDRDTDGSANYADLHYNLGLAYDGLSQFRSSLECYKTALQEYKAQDNQEMEAETLNKIAVVSSTLGEVSTSADYYGEAADAFKRLGNKRNQVLSLTNRASLLGEIKDIEQCAIALKSVIELCEELSDNVFQGKIYNDLGLLYNRLKSYKNAAECFEIAIPLVNGAEQEQQLTAVLEQNLGAVYNQIHKYKTAIEHHKVALRLHGELGNRSAEGQTACNMGFAYSQLKHFDLAIEKFLLAIEIAKDTNDQCSYWQANEGLAAVYFLKAKYQKAVHHYKVALSSLSISGTATEEHNDRIVNKLADAMKFLLTDRESDHKKKSTFKRRPRMKLNDETADGSTGKLVGRTRTRKESTHKLIARGIDGNLDQISIVSDSEEHSSDSSTDSDDAVSQDDRKRGRYIRPSWEKKTVDNNHLTVSSKPDFLLSSPYQGLIKDRNSNSDINDGYEEPADDEQKQHLSPKMPRAHREAYLASIAASTSTPKKTPGTPPSPQDITQSAVESNSANRSRTCVIQ